MNEKDRQEKLGFIFETARALRFHMDQVVQYPEPGSGLACGELSGIQKKAAMQVWLHQPISLGALAQRLDVTPPAASAVVDKLVEKEVLTRETDSEDRRRVVIKTHPRMAEFMNAMNQRFHDAFSAIAGRVGDENVTKWYEVMQQVNAILKEEIPHD